MPHTHGIFCVDGCNTRLGEVTLPDGVEFKGNAHYGMWVPSHRVTAGAAEEQAKVEADQADFDAKVLDSAPRINANAIEIVRRRNQLKNDLEALKQNQPAWWAGVFG